MEPLRDLQFDKPQQNETGISLVKQSSMELPPSSARALATMMAQTQSYFPHQSIPKDTAAVWMSRWVEIMKLFGLETFRDGLSKAVNESEFIPLPFKIEKACSTIRGERRIKEAEGAREAQRAEERRIIAENERSRRENPEAWVSVRDCFAEVLGKVNQNRVN